MAACGKEALRITKPLYRLVHGRVCDTEVGFSSERVCFSFIITHLVHMKGATEQKDLAVFLILGLVPEIVLYRMAVTVEVELWEGRVCHPCPFY